MTGRTRIAALVIAAASALWVLLAPQVASAAPGFTWRKATINGGPRFGSDDLNFGAGINGGYTLDQGVYLGGLFNYFLGETNDFTAGPIENEVGFDAWFLMFEGGYDLGLGRALVLRPSFAAGLVTAHSRICQRGPGGETCDSDTESEFEAALSGQLLYNIDGLTIGPELRLFFGDFNGVWIGFNIGGML